VTIITCYWSLACYDHITPVLRELHWLPIRERVKFKVVCLVRQSLSGQAPVYLAGDCCLVSDSTRRCWRPDLRGTTNIQQRTFTAAGPRLWNSLLVQLRNPDITYGLFRRQLKGHLFGNHVAARSRLRSADYGDLVVPRVLSRFGWRSFRVSGPTIWNDLPVDFRSTDITREQFKRSLKSWLFDCAYGRSASEKQSSLKARLRNGLTYLLTYTYVTSDM